MNLPKFEPSHAGFGVAWRWASSMRKKREFLLVTVTYTKIGFEGRVETKFPGGKEDPEDAGDPFMTFRREFKEETGKLFMEGVTRPVWSDYFRHFYLFHISACKGKMRDVELEEEGSILSVPFWVPEDELLGRNGVVYDTHQEPTRAVFKELGIRSSAWARSDRSGVMYPRPSFTHVV